MQQHSVNYPGRTWNSIAFLGAARRTTPSRCSTFSGRAPPASRTSSIVITSGGENQEQGFCLPFEKRRRRRRRRNSTLKRDAWNSVGRGVAGLLRSLENKVCPISATYIILHETRGTGRVKHALIVRSRCNYNVVIIYEKGHALARVIKSHLGGGAEGQRWRWLGSWWRLYWRMLRYQSGIKREFR